MRSIWPSRRRTSLAVFLPRRREHVSTTAPGRRNESAEGSHNRKVPAVADERAGAARRMNPGVAARAAAIAAFSDALGTAACASRHGRPPDGAQAGRRAPACSPSRYFRWRGPVARQGPPSAHTWSATGHDCHLQQPGEVQLRELVNRILRAQIPPTVAAASVMRQAEPCSMTTAVWAGFTQPPTARRS